MNQKEIDWQFSFAKILKEKSINRLHYETNISSEPFQILSFIIRAQMLCSSLNVNSLLTSP